MNVKKRNSIIMWTYIMVVLILIAGWTVFS